MATVHDVAAFIQLRTGGVDRLKLQKLTYYAQAWTLVWDDKPLFAEDLQAWRHGPVAPALWRAGRDLRALVAEEVPGDAEELTDQEMENVEAVIDYYNQFSGWRLRQMTHQERPWLEARGGIADDEPSRTVIDLRTMQRFYSRLEAESNRHPVRELVGDDDEIGDEEFELLLKEDRVNRPAPRPDTA